MKWTLILFILGSSALALDITPSGLYRATKEACSKVTEADLNNHNFDKLNVGYFPSREFTEIHGFIRSESAKSAALEMNVKGELSITRYIPADFQFKKALVECYPNSRKMQKFFVDSILRSYRAGKMVGIFAMLTAFKGNGRIFSLIKGWSGTAFRYLQIAEKGFKSLILASLLRGDSNHRKESIQWKISDEDLKRESQNLSNMAASLRKQIVDEEKKIKSCEVCPEKAQFEKNKRALLVILSSVDQQ